MGSRSWTARRRSAMYIRTPPSPIAQIVGRRRSARAAPIAIGSPVPIERPFALARNASGDGARHTCSATVQNHPVSTTKHPASGTAPSSVSYTRPGSHGSSSSLRRTAAIASATRSSPHARPASADSAASKSASPASVTTCVASRPSAVP